MGRDVVSSPALSSFLAVMGKSEYFEVRKVEGEVEQPQIILDAEAIYDLLLRAELMMTKLTLIDGKLWTAVCTTEDLWMICGG